MYLSTRASTSTTCGHVSWRVWCPIDIFLWAVSALVVALLFWKIIIHRKTADLPQPNSDGLTRQDFSQNARRLRDIDDLSIKHDCPCGISDPHHIAHSREGSIITFLPPVPTSPPIALLVDTPTKSRSGRLTGLGISFGSTSMMNLPAPVSQTAKAISRQSSMNVSPFVIETEDKSVPPPAYVRDVHADKV